MTEKDKILALLKMFASKDRMASFFIDNTSTDFIFIRPSGNPINAKGLEEMFSSGDITLDTSEITKIHKFEFYSENIAICVFTLESKFIYKGTSNNDLPTVTSIFKKHGGVWKIAWMQRSSGQSDPSLWDEI